MINYNILDFGIYDSSVKFSAASTITRDRKLDCYEIELYTQDCAGTAFVNNSSYKLCRGLLLCLKPGQMRHSRLHFKCSYIHLTCGTNELSQKLDAMPDACRLSDYTELSELFFKMAVNANESVRDKLLLRSYSDRILYLMLSLNPDISQNSAQALPHAEVLREIKNYISRNYSQNLSLDILSAKAALSPVYFHTLFTQYYGITPAQYTLYTRINAAKQLLITTNETISYIASACGFSSQSYFNYKFKEETGLPPLKYRKKMLSRIDF